MTAIFYIFAAFFEIAGCYAFWMWLRLEKSPLWIAPGVVSLILFALLLTRIDAGFAGRRIGSSSAAERFMLGAFSMRCFSRRSFNATLS